MKTYEEVKSEMNAKWTGFTIRARCKVRETYQWAITHKDEAAAIATTGVAALTAILKTAKYVDRKLDQRQNQKLHDLEMYDHSLGLYHHLKHKLRPDEIQEISKRRRNGEPLAVILHDMRLVK